MKRMEARPDEPADETPGRPVELVSDRVVHFLAGFLKRTFRIDGVFDVFDGFIDALAGFFRRAFFLARGNNSHEREQAQRDQFG